MEIRIAANQHSHNATKAVGRRAQLRWLFLSSVLAHAAIIALLAMHIQKPAVMVQDKAPPVIDAMLVFPTRPVVVDEKALVEGQTDIETEVQRAESVEPTNDIETAVEPQPQSPQLATQSEPNRPPPDNSTATPRQPATNQPLSQRMTQSFLDTYNQQAVESLSGRRSQEFQSERRSPDLNIPRSSELAPQDIPGQPIIVACDDTAVNVLRIIGSVMGGAMRCRDKPDIDTFIQRRINKETQ